MVECRDKISFVTFTFSRTLHIYTHSRLKKVEEIQFEFLFVYERLFDGNETLILLYLLTFNVSLLQFFTIVVLSLSVRGCR